MPERPAPVAPGALIGFSFLGRWGRDGRRGFTQTKGYFRERHQPFDRVERGDFYWLHGRLGLGDGRFCSNGRWRRHDSGSVARVVGPVAGFTADRADALPVRWHQVAVAWAPSVVSELAADSTVMVRVRVPRRRRRPRARA
jgi:hypothetical protein